MSPRKGDGRTPGLALLVLALSGCANATPAQRRAIYCNPVAHAVDLAGVLAPYGLCPLCGVFVDDCAQAIKDKVEEAKSKNATPRKSPEPPALEDTSALGSIAE